MGVVLVVREYREGSGKNWGEDALHLFVRKGVHVVVESRKDDGGRGESESLTSDYDDSDSSSPLFFI